MCRIYKWDGIALAIFTEMMMWFGAWCGNRMVIFYWYYEGELKNQVI